VNSPDYKGIPLEEAIADLRKRIAEYEKVYEPISNDELSYIKLINLQSKVICNKVHGRMGLLLASFLMTIHVKPRPIFLVRAGHCENIDGEEAKEEIEGRKEGDEDDDEGEHVDGNTDGSSSAGRKSSISRVSSMEFVRSTNPDGYVIPTTLSMNASLSESGRAFAKRLAVFMIHKVRAWARAHGVSLEGGSPLTSPSPPTNQPKHFKFPPSSPGITSTTGTGVNTSPSTDANSTGVKTGTGTDGTGSLPPPPELRREPSSVLPLYVHTSTLPRSHQTVAPLLEMTSVLHCDAQPSLNMLNTGVCHGMTAEQIREKMPEEVLKWAADRYRYRFPGGESQQDLAASLEPLVLELERQTLPVLVVSHQSTLQVLYGYFLGTSCPPDKYYSLRIPRHTVIELMPHQYGWQERRYDLSTDAAISPEALEAYTASYSSDLASSPAVLHGVNFYSS